MKTLKATITNRQSASPTQLLRELSFVWDPASSSATHSVLDKMARIAGGATSIDAMFGQYLTIGVEDANIEREVRHSLSQLFAQSRIGFTEFFTPSRLCAVCVPLFRNASGGQQPDKLFDGFRPSLRERLSLHAGYHSTVTATGSWLSEGRNDVVFDDNELWLFDVNRDNFDGFLQGVGSTILQHPDCDQESLYISYRGQGYLIE